MELSIQKKKEIEHHSCSLSWGHLSTSAYTNILFTIIHSALFESRTKICPCLFSIDRNPFILPVRPSSRFFNTSANKFDQPVVRRTGLMKFLFGNSGRYSSGYFFYDNLGNIRRQAVFWINNLVLQVYKCQSKQYIYCERYMEDDIDELIILEVFFFY